MTNQALKLNTRILLIDADEGEIYSWNPTCACDQCVEGRFESIPSTLLSA